MIFRQCSQTMSCTSGSASRGYLKSEENVRKTKESPGKKHTYRFRTGLGVPSVVRMGVSVPIYPSWPRRRGPVLRNCCTVQTREELLVVLPPGVRGAVRQKQNTATGTLEDIMPERAASPKGTPFLRQKCPAIHWVKSRHDDERIRRRECR